MTKPSLGSDNHAGIHPQLLQALVDANHGFAASYEQDPWSQKLKQVLNREFAAVDSFMVFNGTAANVLSLQVAVKSYQAVVCADVSHLNVDECGAPEKIAGCKLIAVPTKNGKFGIEELEQLVFRAGDQHCSQIKMVSITQATEYGTVYTLEETAAISEFCLQHGLYLHIDGARLANAAAFLNCSLQELTQFADIVSFGGAKNGLLCGETVIIRNPALREGFKFYRKQSLQLPAKTRFFAAPFLRYLEKGLWREIAEVENRMAQYLHQQIAQKTNLQLTQPTQANAVFCLLPQPVVAPLREKFFFYVWNEKTFEVRLMTSFATTQELLDSFVTELVTLTSPL